jgi:mitochondrial splicing suppressor protein 51
MLLVDSYRLRMENEYALEQETNNDSLYSGDGAPAAIRGLQKFLTLLEKRHRNLLPAWWKAESRGECEALAMDSSQWVDLTCAVEKSDIIKHYKDSTMPMQLQMFAATVYDRGILGQSSDAMLEVMMKSEMGELVTSLVDFK